MTKDQWLKKAKKLRDAVDPEGNGKLNSNKLNDSQLSSLQELQHAIGSHHGRPKSLRWDDATDSLNEMIGWVEGHKKDEMFSDTKKG